MGIQFQLRLVHTTYFVHHTHSLLMLLTSFLLYRGTPHAHTLLAIVNDEIRAAYMNSAVEAEKDLVKREVEAKITSLLTKREPGDYSDIVADTDAERDKKVMDETEYSWQVPKDYHDDRSDPRRARLDVTWDYSYDDTGEFNCKNLKRHYRRLQIANQMHSCCFTCWKYEAGGAKVCRFCYPWKIDDVDDSYCKIIADRDRKCRVRVRAVPPRNNAYMNASPKSLLLCTAHGGNIDLQYISNVVGR